MLTRLYVCLIVCLLGASACGEGPNFQRVPIGTRCTDDDTCGTTPFGCATTKYPGGYCTRSCSTDGECPLDAICVALSCRRRCSLGDDATCRQSEGYVCRSKDVGGATTPYCDIPLAVP